ncbi:MAG: bacteriorhodopsin, partial [Rubrobacter sp.]|nr:bacteriorhodopsin [Rubrobacter sp.]
MRLALMQIDLAELVQSGGELFWLWFTAGGFILATVYFLYLAITGGMENRHHYLTSTVIVLWAAIWYVLMGSGSGVSLVEVSDGGARIFYWGRYIDWLITTPLLLLGLAWIGLGGRVGGHQRMVTYLLGADVLMILTGILAGATGSGFRWFWFVVSSIFFAAVLYLLWGWLRSAAQEGNPEGGFGLFYTLASMLTVLWILYPVVWILGQEGAMVFSSSFEVFSFAVLDILAKIA